METSLQDGLWRCKKFNNGVFYKQQKLEVLFLSPM